MALRRDADLAVACALSVGAVEDARQRHNLLVTLPRTRADRVATWARLSGGASLGDALIGVIVDLGPVSALVSLLGIKGIAEKRLQALTLSLVAASPTELAALTEEAARPAALAALQADLAATKTAQDAANAERDAANAERDAANAERDAAKAALLAAQATISPPTLTRGATVSVSALVQSAGEQLGQTQRQLQRDQHPVRIAALSLTLRGAAGTDEADQVGLRFGADGAPVPENPSELKLAFAPGDRVDSAALAGQVPDVVGYTEALARRKLEARGYAVGVRGTGAATPAERGRVVHQRPAAGEALDPGEAVALHVAR